MSLQKIESALISGYLGAGLALPTQYENIDFSKPDSSPWAAVWFVPNDPIMSSLGDDGFDEYNGFLQVDLNYARNDGRKKSREHYEILRNHFKAGTVFTDNGQSVMSTHCGMSQGREIDGWYRVSVSIYFRAYVER